MLPSAHDLQAAVHDTNVALRNTEDHELARAITHERRILSMVLDGYRQALDVDRLMHEPPKVDLVKILGLEHPLGASPMCQSNGDGECDWELCPQQRDGEPAKSGRSCPLFPWDEAEL